MNKAKPEDINMQPVGVRMTRILTGPMSKNFPGTSCYTWRQAVDIYKKHVEILATKTTKRAASLNFPRPKNNRWRHALDIIK
jgi:hypothetical protein